MSLYLLKINFKLILLLAISLMLSGCIDNYLQSNGKRVLTTKYKKSNTTKIERSIKTESTPIKNAKNESYKQLPSENICHILKKYPSWYKHAKKAEKRWGLPAHVQFAIIRYESHFDGNARPLKKVKKGFKYAMEPASSAYGYAQAKTITWREYAQLTKKNKARRDRFADAVDFIGWYNHRSHSMLGLKKNDAFRLYLAYHEGQGGYKNRSYRKKPWLIKVAKKVQASSKLYKKQIVHCKKNINRQLALN